MNETLDTEGASAPLGRMARRRDGRRRAARNGLAGVAALGMCVATLSLVALSAPAATQAKAVHLPSAKAAAAAFTTGLKAAKSTPSTAAPSTTSGGVAIAIKNYAFAPAAITIKAGTKVTWTNDDTAPHTVTVDSGPVTFSSPTLQKGDSFTYTFTVAGTYSYYCAVHPDMTAKVVVTSTTPTPTPTSTSTSTPTPTPTSTSSMPMPPTTGGSDCAVSFALQTFLTHLNTAHLEESPQQQVSDILNIDTYIGNHLALVERMLSPLTNGGLANALTTALQALFIHVDTGHLGESPAQQVSDILNVNQYIATHLALVQKMLSGFEAMAC